MENSHIHPGPELRKESLSRDELKLLNAQVALNNIKQYLEENDTETVIDDSELLSSVCEELNYASEILLTVDQSTDVQVIDDALSRARSYQRTDVAQLSPEQQFRKRELLMSKIYDASELYLLEDI